MDVTTEELDGGKLVLTVVLAAGEMGERIRKAAIAIAYREHIAPDPATTPERAVEEKLGNEEYDARVAEQIMDDAVPFALDKAGLDIVGLPTYLSARPARAGRSFEFTLECVRVPRIELPSYDPVEITIMPAELSADLVAEQIDALARQHAVQEIDAAKRTVKRGDTVELAMETVKDGERVRGLCRPRNRYTTGSAAMPDGFDEAVIGMAVGDTADIEFEGPGFGVDGNGDPIMERYRSTVTVNGVLKEVVPEVTDRWVASTVPDCSTVAELESKVEQTLAAQLEGERFRQKELLAASELAKRFDAKIEDAVYDAAMREAKKGFLDELERQNTTLEAFLEQEHMEEQQLGIALMMQVKEQLVRQLSLEALADHLDLEVEETDLDAYFEAIAPGRADQARSDFARSGRMRAAQAAARRAKANRYLVEHAVIHEAPVR